MPHEVGMWTRAIFIYNNYQLIINETLYIYIETIGTALLEVCYSNTEERQHW